MAHYQSKGVRLGLVAWSFSVAANSAVMSASAFTQYSVHYLTQHHPNKQVSAPSDLTLELGQGSHTQQINLQNLYAQYQQSPDKLTLLVADFDNALQRSFAHQDTALLTAVIPLLRDKTYVANIQQLESKNGITAPNQLYVEKVNEELYLLYAFDSPDSIRLASHKDMAALRQQSPDVKQRAFANLLTRMPDIRVKPLGEKDLLVLTADGNFESSLLLYGALWDHKNFDVKGDIVVFVPARNVVLVTGSKDTAAIAHAKALVNSRNWSYGISRQAFIKTAQGWRVLTASEQAATR
ncbi:DUF1444 domain-containing protein [Gallaecimonas mangrovi]|uniref:DUF1444 family protein n=1 Tax=Gallaecimonas mangrovi TaxID=2291597 RepID=UPI000E206DA2|nr:DUF1444 family protein [Gallaecimonas mangrovi]